MVRKLKHHEQKLLKKVDFYEKNRRVSEVMHRYHIQRREDYTKYNRLCGQIEQLATKIAALNMRDPFRLKKSEQLLERLYSMGILSSTKNLSLCQRITASSFCRRRIPVVMMRLKMAESVKQAVKMVEQGHVRVGPNTITDPAFLVTRRMQDFVTWVDSSKIKRHIAKYNDKLDDFDLL